ncbi:ABC-2 type transport system permease protein [Oribacterium sinus]|uniref:ABC-2 type transport system permease protein n=1 Tax=Oribacterium sinus TaxID=237576 RepID=A0A7W9SDW5_9FIRM|nr:ABC transporter permease [Oribacterium sinus]MBB6040242.1 ABC-2 type transport system permease protein [Oribacterium sinus]
MMRTYLFIDLKIMFRIPLSIFFSIAYPILMMIIIMFSYGNISIGNGYYLIDKYFLIAIGMGILPLSLISFPMWIGNSFENKSIERLNFFGVNTSKMFVGDVLAHFILAMISMAINILVAFLFWRLKFPSIGHFLSFIIQYFIAIVIAMIIGGIFAYVFKNPQILMTLGLVVMFVLYMFCGVFISIDQMPQLFRNISSYLPIKYAMNDFFDIWTMEKFWDKDFLLISAVYLVISTIVLGICIIRENKRVIYSGGKNNEK